MGHRRVAALVLGATALAGCGEPPAGNEASSSACVELATKLGLQWRPDELSVEDCQRMDRRIASWLLEGETFEDFTDRVLLQSNQVQNALMRAVSEERVTASFSRFPDKVPCVEGTDLQGEWSSSPLGLAGLGAPDRLYYSFSVEIISRSGDTLRVRYAIHQNLDCDDVVGVADLEGEQILGGNPFLPSGWTTLRSSWVSDITE